MAAAVTLIILAIELVLALGFVAGLFWLGGWPGGLLIAGVALLLLVIGWAGELAVRFDSREPAAAVRVGWWGRVTLHTGADVSYVTVRVLGIPWRRRLEKKPGEEEADTREAETVQEAAAEPRKETRGQGLLGQIDAESIEGWLRAALSGLATANDLLWSARELRVWIEGPIQRQAADRALERLFGRRAVGPADVEIVQGEGQRRVRIRYRIGLLRAALAGLQLMVDGRPMAVMRMAKKHRAEEGEQEEVDRDLIDEILSAREGEDDGGV